MDKLTTMKHWTDRSTDDFLYKISADFVQQIENYMAERGMSQAQFAATLGVSPGRVSQVLNNPGNLSLRKVVEYARSIGKKVAVVAYDDGDANNQNGPINSQVFAACWEQAGSPSDLIAMDTPSEGVAVTTYTIAPDAHLPIQVMPMGSRSNARRGTIAASNSVGTDATSVLGGFGSLKFMEEL